MPSDRFKADQYVIVSHVDALKNRVQYRGKIVKHVEHDTWQVTVIDLGMHITFDEKDIRDGE